MKKVVMRNQIFFIIILIAMFFLMAPIVQGEAQVIPTNKLLALDGDSADVFGWSVAIDDSFAVIGAPYDEEFGANSGAAYVFKFDGNQWNQFQKLYSNDIEEGDHFGESVFIRDNYVIIGASSEDESVVNAGAAYIFYYDGLEWLEEAKLIASEGTPAASFGSAVAIDDSYAIVGAPMDSEAGFWSGAAYLFKKDGEDWIQIIKLLPDQGQIAGSFGASVDLYGDCAVVGSPVGNVSVSPLLKSVYVYRRIDENWIKEDNLRNEDGESTDSFSFSLSIYGNLIAAGALGEDNENGIDAGSVYLFEKLNGQWTQTAKLISYDGSAGDNFGYSLDVCDTNIVVGATGDQVNGDFPGAAYIYKKVNGHWVHEKKLEPLDGAANDWFGNSVSITGDHCIVGAMNNDDNGTNSGSAYVFKNISDFDFDNDGHVDVKDIQKLIDELGLDSADPSFSGYDVNMDGVIDIMDVKMVFVKWGDISH